MKTSSHTTVRELQEYIKPYSSREIVPFTCSYCEKPVLNKTKHDIQLKILGMLNLNGRKKSQTGAVTCDRSCGRNYYSLVTNALPEIVKCANCGVEFKKSANQILKSKNHFCRKSCAATFNNTHKKTGIRRSKIEQWLEEELIKLYPNLEIHFNRKDAINSELDIYIPSLHLAFELNGIFHYEPIYGEEKLKSIQNNDNRKFQACLQSGIELCIIDVSSISYFKPKFGYRYLDIITGIVNEKFSHDFNKLLG